MGYREAPQSSAPARWLAPLALLLAALLVPFFLWGERLDVWAADFARSPADRRLVGLALGLLLAADVVLPVPSSLVSTALGALLGWPGGFLVSTLGMTAACWAGHRLGGSAGRGAAGRLVSERDLAWLEAASRRWGAGAIVLLRAVPALAEASAIFAGVSRMPLGRFLLVSALSNAGISAVYAAVGAYAAGAGSFLLAFAGALLLPGLAQLAAVGARALRGPAGGGGAP